MDFSLKKITQLCSWGASKAVRIPKEMCDQMGISAGSALYIGMGIDERGSFILVRPEKEQHRTMHDAPYLSMDSLFAGFNESNQPSECDWGEDVGGEVIE